MQDKLADRIRSYAFENYIRPAREAGHRQVTIRAGDVHEGMGLSGRMPAVCGALGTQAFEREYHVRRLRMEGPTQGASTTFTFDVS